MTYGERLAIKDSVTSRLNHGLPVSCAGRIMIILDIGNVPRFLCQAHFEERLQLGPAFGDAGVNQESVDQSRVCHRAIPEESAPLSDLLDFSELGRQRKGGR